MPGFVMIEKKAVSLIHSCDDNTDIIFMCIYSMEWEDDYERSVPIWNCTGRVHSNEKPGNIIIC
jgi:hypothetical protein